jgi:L-alanine-DL-glutamate epimerase-like enolase superfamily enzyme
LYLLVINRRYHQQLDVRLQGMERIGRAGLACAICRSSVTRDKRSPVPIASDESVQSLADIPGLAGRFSVANIKLDKCGGLTEGLAMARALREFGLEVMVGNMLGTSLAMAPAFLVGQLCKIVDLDGPVSLKADRATAIDYTSGFIRCPETLWGNAD